MTNLIALGLLTTVLVAAARGEEKTYAAWSKFDPANFDPDHTHAFEVGDIRVVIGDHYPHGGSERSSYTGIHHLSHRQWPSNVFNPRYAGVIGLRRACTIEKTGRNSAAIWIDRDGQRISESYSVVQPHYIDHAATFVANAGTGYWNDTCYTNGPSDPGIHVRQTDGTWVRHYSEKHGHQASIAPASWTAGDFPTITPVADSRYPHGGRGFHEGFCDLRFDPAYPIWYGRFDEMVLVVMMDRKLGNYFVPFMSPTGGGFSEEFQRPNPAWDYRCHLRDLVPGKPVTVRSRLIFKPFVSHADIVTEYEAWLKALPEDSLQPD